MNLTEVEKIMQSIKPRTEPDDALVVMGEQVHGVILKGRLMVSQRLMTSLTSVSQPSPAIPLAAVSMEVVVSPLLPMSEKAATTMIGIARRPPEPLPLRLCDWIDHSEQPRFPFSTKLQEGKSHE